MKSFGRRIQVRPVRARRTLQVLNLDGPLPKEVFRGTKAQVKRELVRQKFAQDRFDPEMYFKEVQ